MLEIYVNFDNIYKIYDNYIKNKNIEIVVNNIYSRLKEFPRPQQSDDLSIESSQSTDYINQLSPQLNEIIDGLTDKSIHLSDLDDLSISLKMSDPKNEKWKQKINKEDYEN